MPEKRKISVVTPAHNEEFYIEKCLHSVRTAAAQVAETFPDATVEHVVVLNRCTDRTGEIAHEFGARTVVEDARFISRVRNAGADAATGDILVTIDADSWMSTNMLTEVIRMLESGKYIGGGVRTLPERVSLGIFCSILPVIPVILWHRISAGMFWCYAKDFHAIGGFDESMCSVEDIDLAKRLRKHGRRLGKKYGTIRRAKITTSCRKFDTFGDWYLARHPMMIRRIFRGEKRAVDQFYYDFDKYDKNQRDSVNET